MWGVLVAAACEVQTRVVEKVPVDFAGRVNPLPDDEATIERGRRLFVATCASCHGERGDGNGIAAPGLVPPPASFRDPGRFEGKGDDFLFWRISKGSPGTAMPAFGATLSEEDRWAILRFIRHLER